MIYLDHSSTTPVDPEVLRAMMPYFSEKFANPSGLYSLSRNTYQAVAKSRVEIAKFLNCSSDEIYFTSGGSESDNLAIFGLANKRKSGHIITTKIEHPAVLKSCERLEENGFSVTYLSVDDEGYVDLDQLKNSLREDTFLVSIMYANNEIGTIEPIKEISKIIEEYKENTGKKDIYLHTDACQATNFLEMNVQNLGVDLLTFSGSKIYAPKGIGVLYVRTGIPIDPMIFGGGQENNLRSGTENVAYIVGISKAVELIPKRLDQNKKLIDMRDELISRLLKIDQATLNGPLRDRLPNNINISFAGIEGESAVLMLDRMGIAVSTGSACSSMSLEPSHVIVATGKSKELAHSSLRFTIGLNSDKNDIEKIVNAVEEVITKLREMSPLWK